MSELNSNIHEDRTTVNERRNKRKINDRAWFLEGSVRGLKG